MISVEDVPNASSTDPTGCLPRDDWTSTDADFDHVYVHQVSPNQADVYEQDIFPSL